MKNNFFILIFLIFNTLDGSSQNFGSDYIEVYFTQSITQRYQSESNYPYKTGGPILKERILRQINEAKNTIDLCMYNNSDNNIVSALKSAQTRGVRVRYIADQETANSAINGSVNFKILYANPGEGIMHSKFIIADANTTDANIMIGSSNFTNNGFNDDANNILFIKNTELAQAFTTEFEEMWDSSGPIPGNNPKSGEDKTDNTPHHFMIVGIPIELYFSPSDHTEEHMDEILLSAQFNIRFAIYTFTSDLLSSRIVQKKNEGILVRGITDNNDGSFGKLLYMQQNGVDVLDHTPSSLLHHKYAVIDAEYADSDPVVITGSHNWTYSANNINDETTLFIHDMNLAKLYAAEFNSRYCELAPWDCNLIATHEQEQLEMKMFPSLAADYVHIELDRIPNGPISIIVYNEAGLPVLFKKNENITQSLNFEIDIKALPKGIYFIKLLTSDKFEKTQKIIKL